MRRRLGMAFLLFAVGCGASAKTGASAPAGSGMEATKEAEAEEAQKKSQLQEQTQQSEDEAEREQLERKLRKQDEKEKENAHEDDKKECKCVPGDPLCSCVSLDQGVKGKKKATVHAASTSSMSGRLSPEQVESAVAQQIDVFAACTHDDVTVSLKALITEKGVVARVSAGKSQPDKASLRECVAAAFKTIQFPASSDGKSVPIEFDLVLSPSS